MRYERYLDKWIKVVSMNIFRVKFGMVILDGYIYVIGGYDGIFKLCFVERYCLQINRWIYVFFLLQFVVKIVVIFLNGYLYVVGMFVCFFYVKLIFDIIDFGIIYFLNYII